MRGKQKEKDIKYPRTYDGLEFCGEDFSAFCMKNGITKLKTIRYTPQQNGVVKILTRTIVERVTFPLSVSCFLFPISCFLFLVPCFFFFDNKIQECV